MPVIIIEVDLVMERRMTPKWVTGEVFSKCFMLILKL